MSGDDSGGGGAGGSGGNNGGGRNSNKKQKREKVTQRGPGVAELEKKLREETASNFNDNSFLPNPSPFPVDHYHFPPRAMATTPHVQGGSDAVFPSLRGSSESASSMYGKAPAFSPGYPVPRYAPSELHDLPDIHFSHLHPSMINTFQLPETVSSSNNLPRGYRAFRPLEHPSNQRPYQKFNSALPQDDMMGRRQQRQRTFSNPRPPGGQSVRPLSTLQIPQQPPSFRNPNPFSPHQSRTIPRDPNMNITDLGGHNFNYNMIGSSTSSQPDFSRSSSPHVQESHRISTHSAASVDNQPLNHLLTPEEKMREEAITLSLNIKKDDEEEEESNLDLDLKL